MCTTRHVLLTDAHVHEAQLRAKKSDRDLKQVEKERKTAGRLVKKNPKLSHTCISITQASCQYVTTHVNTLYLSTQDQNSVGENL